MCYSSRLKIIKKQYLFRVSLDACTHEWRKIKKNIPRKAHRKSIICFFLLFVSEIWHTLQFTRQKGGGGGGKWIKQEFCPFLTFSVNLPVNLPCLVTMTSVFIWHQIKALGRHGKVLQFLVQVFFSFHCIAISCLITWNLNRVSCTLYYEGWINILLDLFAYLWSVMFCSAESLSFFFFSLPL